MKVSGYIDVLLHEFDRYYVDLCSNEHLDEVSIHELRVAYKQIFALYKVLLFIAPQYSQGIMEDMQILKGMFKKSGEIRDRHIILNLVSLESFLENKGDLVKVLHKEIKQLEKEFSDSFQNYSYSLMRMHLYQTFSVLDGMKKSVFSNLIEDISELYNRKIERVVTSEKTDFHKIRRYVKQQFYILDMYDHLTKKQHNRIFLRRLKKVGKLLGEWHDHVILKKYLEDMANQVSLLYLEDIDKRADGMLKEMKHNGLLCKRV